MVGEHKIVFLHHPSYLRQESANHRGIDVKHLVRFNCFHISLPSDALCMGFYIPRTLLRHLQLQSRAPKSQHTMVAELLEKMLILGPCRSEAFNTTLGISTRLLCHGKKEGQTHTQLHGLQEIPPRRRNKMVQG